MKVFCQFTGNVFIPYKLRKGIDAFALFDWYNNNRWFATSATKNKVNDTLFQSMNATLVAENPLYHALKAIVSLLPLLADSSDLEELNHIRPFKMVAQFGIVIADSDTIHPKNIN